jgi:hypothetical protein
VAGGCQGVAGGLPGRCSGILHPGGDQPVTITGFDHETERMLVQAQETRALGVFAAGIHQAQHVGAEIHPGVDVRGLDPQVSRCCY